MNANEPLPPADEGRLDLRVGRPAPEREEDDGRYFADCAEEYDDWVCDRCHGDGMDPWVDYLLPCSACQGEQRP